MATSRRPRRIQRYPDEFRNAALARLANERPYAIAKDLNISPSQIRRWKEERDHPKQRKIRYFSDDFKRAAVARVLAGETLAAVASELTITSGVLSGWTKKKQFSDARPAPPPPRMKNGKKYYYVKVAERAAQAQENGGVNLMRKVHACIGMLRGIRGQVDNNDPVHLTALLVLATLEGKM